MARNFLVSIDAYDPVPMIGTSPAFTFTRASNAYKGDGTLLVTHQPHYEAGKFGEGVMVEEGTTNVFVNPAAPATQTISLGTGSWTISVIGAGTVTSSAGTATATGYGVASSGVPNTITVTVAGTVVFTVAGAGTTSRVQVENKPHPTSWVNGTRVPEAIVIPTANVLIKDSFTIECWAKTQNEGEGDFRMPFSAWEHFYVALTPANVLRVSWIENGVQQTSEGQVLASPNEWHHWAFTRNNGTYTLYVDGVSVVTGSYSPSTISVMPANLDVGKLTNGSYQWNGLIDDLRISNKARTAAEILANYQSGKPAAWDEFTTAIYRFNEPKVKTLRYSTLGYTSGPNDDPPNTYYPPYVANPGLFQFSMYSPGKLSGQSTTGTGEVVLSNPSGELDDLIDYGLDGRRIVVEEVTDQGPSPFLVGTMEQPSLSLNDISIRLRDRQAELDVPFQPIKYTGSNVLPLGFDGTDDIKGKPRPKLYGGPCFNIEPEMVNSSKLIYQICENSTDVETSPNDFSMWYVRAGDSLAGDLFTFAAGSFNAIGAQFYRSYSGLASGTYEWQAEVKADRNMNLILTANNSAIWDSCSYGQNFSLSSGVWKTVCLVGSVANGRINLHLGASGQTELAAVSQDAGVIQVRNVRLLLKENPSVYGTNGVYDAGATITRGTPYADIRDLIANAPAAGTFRLYGPYFRLGSSPSGQITCDAFTSTASVGQNVKKVVTSGPIAAADVIEQGIIDLDAANNSEIGIYVKEETTYAAVIDQLCASVGAWYGFENNGKFVVRRLELPAGAPMVAIDDAMLLRMERLATNDQGRGIPAYRVNLDYAKNFTVQTTGLAGSVTDTRRQWLKLQYRTVHATDMTVKEAHLLSPEINVQTLLLYVDKAQTEANRLGVMYGSRRDYLKAVIPRSQLLFDYLGFWDGGYLTKLPVNRTNHAAVVHNDHLYVVAGYALKSVIRLDLSNMTGAWDDAGVTDLPSWNRWNHAAVVHNNYLYVVGGYIGSSNTTASVIRLDLSNPAGAWDDAGVTDLPQARGGHLAVVHNNYLYVFGGYPSMQTSAIRLDLNNPTGAWDDVGVTDLPIGVDGGAQAVLHGNFVYIVGPTNNQSKVIRLDLSNPAGAWDDAGVTDLPAARYDHAAVVMDNHLYVIAGMVSGYTGSVIRLNLTNPAGAWESVADLPTKLAQLRAVAYQGRVLTMGGATNQSVMIPSYLYRSNRNPDDLAHVWDRNKVIKLKTNRFGYCNNKLMRIVGAEVDVAADLISLFLWG